jgi:hypothetical protein
MVVSLILYILHQMMHTNQSKSFYTYGVTCIYSCFMCSSEDSVIDLESEDSYKYRVLRKKAMRDQRRVTETAIELGYQRSKLEVKESLYLCIRRNLTFNMMIG